MLQDSSDVNEVVDNYSTDCAMTKPVRRDKKFKEPTMSKNTLCKKRATMELVASGVQKKQAVDVYRHHVKDN